MCVCVSATHGRRKEGEEETTVKGRREQRKAKRPPSLKTVDRLTGLLRPARNKHIETERGRRGGRESGEGEGRKTAREQKKREKVNL